MAKVLISGINGFIGRALTKKLLEQGHEVSALGIEEESRIENINYSKCDVLDKARIAELSKDQDVYVHLAAITAHDDIVNHAIKTLQINWEGTHNMLDAFIQNGGKHFIYASTGKVYGDFSTLPITEEEPPKPLNILGKSKYICERLIDFFHNQNSDRRYSILRIFNIYGEGQRESFLVPTILKQVASGTINLGDIKAKRDYLYKDDLMSAFAKILEQDQAGIETYNVGSGKDHSAEEIAKTIGGITGKELTINSDSDRIRKDELDIEYCSNQKLKDIGWIQEYDLEAGLKKTIECKQ